MKGDPASDQFFSYLGCTKWHQRLRVWLARKILKSLKKEGLGLWVKLWPN